MPTTISSSVGFCRAIPILKEAGKSYYGLAADWTNGEGSGIKYFLNPKEQDIYQWGWYSLQDLLDWCKDEGKILKAKK